MTENLTIKKVTKDKNWFDILTKESIGFGLDTKYKVTPKVGDKITLYCHRGSMIRGIDLNGKKIYYKTDKQLEEEHKEWCANYEKEQQDKFKKEKKSLDLKYNKLPKVFQQRIDKYRKNNPNFRVDFESYEMFCCEQAIEIAKVCKTIKGIENFKKLKTFEEQKKMVKKLSDGYSGNTFGASCVLAYWYLEQPENVVKMHGALAPLVGSKEYGDIPKK